MFTIKQVIIVIFYGFLVMVQSQQCTDSSARPGRCTTMARCPNLFTQFYDDSRSQLPNGDFQTFVSGSICGFDGSNFMVCCSQQFLPPRPPRQPMMPPPQQLPSASVISSSYELYFVPLNNSGYGGVASSSLYTPPGAPQSQPLPPQNSWNPQQPPLQTTNMQQSFPSQPASPPVYQPLPQQPTGNQSPPPPTSYQPLPPTLQPTAYHSLPPQPNVPGLLNYSGPALLNQIPIVPRPRPQQLSAAAPIIKSGITECGISHGSTNRVVGGVEAKRGTYPWIAALGYNEQNVLKYLCSGSLISASYVLTSAHCVNSMLLLVRLGAHNLANTHENGAMDFTVKRAVVHENFDLKSIANDIAIIELSNAAPSTTYISPICLPESQNFLSQDFVGMHPFVAGWGAIKYQGSVSQVLRDAQVPVVSRQLCEQSYRSVFQFVQFSDKLICAGNINVDACQGDSGGPLMMPQLDANTYRYFLLGIVSYGYECAKPGFPGVYTRVVSYLPWIRRQMV